MSLFTDEFIRQLAKNTSSNAYRQGEKFGHNDTVGTSFEDVWLQSTDIVLPTTARTLTVQSSGNDNGAASSGARTVIIEGLDANYNEISEEIATVAAADPTTTNSFLRVNRMYVGDVGTNGTNENAITVTTTTDLDIQANIGAGLGQSEKTQFTVPANYNCIVHSWSADCGKGEDFEIEFITQENGKGKRVRQRAYVYQNQIQEDIFIVCPAKCDMKISAKSITNAGKPISASYNYVMYDTTVI